MKSLDHKRQQVIDEAEKTQSDIRKNLTYTKKSIQKTMDQHRNAVKNLEDNEFKQEDIHGDFAKIMWRRLKNRWLGNNNNSKKNYLDIKEKMTEFRKMQGLIGHVQAVVQDQKTRSKTEIPMSRVELFEKMAVQEIVSSSINSLRDSNRNLSEEMAAQEPKCQIKIRKGLGKSNQQIHRLHSSNQTSSQNSMSSFIQESKNSEKKLNPVDAAIEQNEGVFGDHLKVLEDPQIKETEMRVKEIRTLIDDIYLRFGLTEDYQKLFQARIGSIHVDGPSQKARRSKIGPQTQFHPNSKPRAEAGLQSEINPQNQSSQKQTQFQRGIKFTTDDQSFLSSKRSSQIHVSNRQESSSSQPGMSHQKSKQEVSTTMGSTFTERFQNIRENQSIKVEKRSHQPRSIQGYFENEKVFKRLKPSVLTTPLISNFKTNKGIKQPDELNEDQLLLLQNIVQDAIYEENYHDTKEGYDTPQDYRMRVFKGDKATDKDNRQHLLDKLVEGIQLENTWKLMDYQHEFEQQNVGRFKQHEQVAKLLKKLVDKEYVDPDFVAKQQQDRANLKVQDVSKQNKIVRKGIRKLNEIERHFRDVYTDDSGKTQDQKM